MQLTSLCVPVSLEGGGGMWEGKRGPQTLLAAHASDWMEPIINQEQFLPIIQKVLGGGGSRNLSGRVKEEREK